MLGALLGDFVFGRQGLERFGDEERREILLHRRVDRFTDSHPDIVALRALFPEGPRRFAGIALDVYFDHLLARDWARWAGGDGHPDAALERFAKRAYGILESRLHELPPRLQAIVPAMRDRDWLTGYRDRASVDRAVSRIAHRLSRHGERLVACLPHLRWLELQGEAAFERFYPALIDFARSERATLD